MKKTRNKLIRLCKTCNTPKSIEEFYPDRDNGWKNNFCIECTRRDKRRRNWKHRHSMDFDKAEELWETVKQCQICGKSKNLHIDHCHETGKVRGVLCFTCNVAIGLLKDNKELCTKASEYLDAQN